MPARPKSASRGKSAAASVASQEDELRQDSFIFDDDDDQERDEFGMDSDVDDGEQDIHKIKSTGTQEQETVPVKASVSHGTRNSVPGHQMRPASAPAARGIAGDRGRGVGISGLKTRTTDEWARDTLKRLRTEQLGPSAEEWRASQEVKQPSSRGRTTPNRQ